MSEPVSAEQLDEFGAALFRSLWRQQLLGDLASAFKRLARTRAYELLSLPNVCVVCGRPADAPVELVAPGGALWRVRFKSDGLILVCPACVS